IPRLITDIGHTKDDFSSIEFWLRQTCALCSPSDGRAESMIWIVIDYKFPEIYQCERDLAARDCAGELNR
ncbi:MAG: hypothetical protein AAFV26_03180, partial [Pseudomonadota bacterium]